MASIYDLYVEQGSDFTQRIDSTGNYTGYAITMTIKDSVGTSTTGYTTWHDASIGQFDIDITNTQSAALTKGVGYYDIEVSSGGSVDRILQGRIYVDGAV